MSSNIVITIGREFGSGGREIGQKVAKALGISFYDKNLIEIAAEKSGINTELLYQADEKATNPFFSSYLPTGSEYGTVNDRLFWTQSAIIRELAEKESCVIVGRCADYVLEEFENCMHLYITAPMNKRIERIRERYLIDDDSIARKEIARNDKIRRSYYQYYTDRKWGAVDGQTFTIDSSFLGVDGTVDLIVDIVHKKWPDLEIPVNPEKSNQSGKA